MGWIISTKSQVEPTTDIAWMGKHLDGNHYSLMQSFDYMATTTALWIKLATKGSDQRTMRRLCGTLVWASRPSRGAMPFLSGALAWLNWGPKQSKYTLRAVLCGLMEALALSVTPWKAPPTINPTEDTWYVDAASDDFR